VGKKPAAPTTPAVEAGEEEDDKNFVSTTTHAITLKQKDQPFVEIRDTVMGAAITYLLLELEGVDTEPDILDKSKKGPWTSFVTEFCCNLFALKYGESISLTICDKNITFVITYEDLTLKKAGISNLRANSRAMASVMADISTHIVIRIYIKAIANLVGLNHFKLGLLEAGLRMVTANRERRKIDTTAGLLATAGEKFIWHVYVVPITGPTFGFNWPKKILIDVDGDKYSIDYAIRASLELGGKDSNLCASTTGLATAKATTPKRARPFSPKKSRSASARARRTRS
jgi:hypothetical protein